MKAIIATAALALVLTGCNSIPSFKSHDKPRKHESGMKHHHGKVKKFVCNNDAEPTIRRLNENQIEITVDGQATVLNATPSGSGERYESATGVYGKGGVWHQKADEATFVYHDVGSPASCKAKR